MHNISLNPTQPIVPTSPIPIPGGLQKNISISLTKMSKTDSPIFDEDTTKSILENPISANLFSSKSSSDAKLRAFAHIHSDSILKDTNLEGSDLATTTADLHELLKACSPPTLPKGTKDELQLIINKINQLNKEQKSFNLILGKNKDSSSITNDIKRRAQEIKEEIKQLHSGSSFVMGGGWEGEPCGHAMLYEFIKNADSTYDLILYNTGAGTHIHDNVQIREKDKILPALRFSNVPADELYLDSPEPTLIEELLKLQILPSKLEDRKYLCYSSDDIYVRILGHLGKYHKSALGNSINEFITGQRSGTCAWKVLTAFMHNSISDKKIYKRIKYEIKFHSMISFYKDMENTLYTDVPLGDQARVLLNHAAKKLMRTVAKLYDPQNPATSILSKEEAEVAYATAWDILKKLQGAEEEIAAARRKQSTQVNLDGLTGTLKNAVKSFIQNLSVKSPPSNASNPPLEVLKIPQRPDPDDLHNELQICANLLNSPLMITDRHYKKQVKHYVEQLIGSFPIPGSPEGISYWEQILRKNLVPCMEKFDFIMNAYADSIGKSAFPEELVVGGTIHAIQVCLALQYDKTRKKDLGEPLLADYRFTSAMELFHTNPINLFFHPATHKRYLEIQQYFKTFDQTKNNFSDPNIIDPDQKTTSGWLTYFHEMIQCLGAKADKKFLLDTIDLSSFPRQARHLFSNPKQQAICCGTSIDVRSKTGKMLKQAGLEHLVWLKRSEIMNKSLPQWSEHKPQIGDPMNTLLNFDKGQLIIQFGFQNKAIDLTKTFQAERMHQTNPEEKNAAFHFAHYLKMLHHSKANADEGDILLEVQQPGLSSDSFRTNLNKLLENKTLKHPSEVIEILTACSPSSKMETLQLLRFFQDNCNQFDQLNMRLLCELLFFRTQDDGTLGWVKELQNQDQEEYTSNILLDQCRNFVAKGMQPRSTAEGKRDLLTPLFFIRFAQRIGLQLKDKSWPISLLSTLDNMLETKLIPPLTDQELRAIHLHRMTHYANVTNLGEDDVAKLVESWVYVSAAAVEEESGGPEMEEWAYGVLREHMPQIEQVLLQTPTIRNRALTQVLVNLNVLAPQDAEISWQCDKFPSYSCMHAGAKYSVNILTGEIYNSDSGMRRGKKKLPTFHENYRRIFGDREYLCEEFDNAWIFQDKINGPIRVMHRNGGAKQKIQRQFCLGSESKWYQDIKPNKLEKIFPHALLTDHTHWISLDKPNHLIIADRITGEPAYVALGNGSILSWSEWKKNNYNFTPELEALSLNQSLDKADACNTFFERIKSFDEQEGYVLLWEKQEKLKEITFSRYSSLDGIPLSFDISQNQVTWSGNRQFVLGEQKKGLLGNYNNYLHLTHQKGNKQKLLVPMREVSEKKTPETQSALNVKEKEIDLNSQQRHTNCFLEFDLENGKLVSSTIEGKLFLAYLFLAQRDYCKALQYLKQITQTDSLTEKSIKIMEWILKSAKALGDQSPNAAAIRLHTAHLLSIQEQRMDKEMPSYNSSIISDLGEAFSIYYNGINNVDAALKLSENHEKELFSEGCILNVYFWKKENFQSQHDIYKRSDLSIYRHTIPRITNPWGNGQHFTLPNFMNPKTVKDHEIEERFLEFYEYAKNSPERRAWLHYKLDQLKCGYYGNLINLLYLVLQHPEEMPQPLLSGATDKEKESWIQALYDQCTKYPEIPNVCKGSSCTLESPKAEPCITLPLKIANKVIKNIVPLKAITCSKPSLELSSLVATHLVNTTTPIKTKTSHLALIAKADLLKEEKPYFESIQDALDAFNVDLSLGSAENQKREFYAVRDANTVNAMTSTLKTSLSSLKTEKIYGQMNVEELEQEIKRLANIQNADSTIALREKLVRGGDFERELNMGQIIALYLKGDPNDYLAANPYLGMPQPPKNQTAYVTLDQMISCYLQRSTQIQQIERCLGWLGKIADTENVLEQQGLTLQLAEELKSQRQYTPGTAQKERVFLVFEYQSNMMLRSKQCHLIDTMLKKEVGGNYKNLITQLIMGGGKTAVLASILLMLAADKKSLSIFITPAAQFESVKENLRNSQRKNFGQNISVIDVPRASLDLKNLEKIENTIKKTKVRKEILMIKSEVVQSLQLEWLSLMYRQKNAIGGKDEMSKIIKLQTILKEIKEAGQALLDEVDMLLDIHLEVNFPEGEAQAVSDSQVDLIEEIFIAMTGSELDALIGLRENNQVLMTEQTYNEKVLPALAKHLVDYTPLQVDQNRKDSFKRFVSNKMESILQFLVDVNEDSSEVTKKLGELKAEILQLEKEDTSKEDNQALLALLRKNYSLLLMMTNRPPEPDMTKDIRLSETKECYIQDLEFLKWLKEQSESPDPDESEAAQLISLAKGILNDILPVCLQKSCNRNFGRTKNSQKLGQVVPYLGVDTPATTEFGNHYENICYHMMTSLAEGVSEGQVASLANRLVKAATYFSEQEGKLFEETAEAIEFKELTGVNLNTIDDPQKLAIAVRKINSYRTKDVRKLLDMESETVGQYVTYHKKRLCSTPLSLVNMFASVRGFSGTPWNSSSFEASLADNTVPDKGTEGKIFDVLLDRLENKTQQMHVVNQTTPDGILQEIFSQDHPRKQDIRGIIDSGAVFTGMSNLQVAQKILEQLSTIPGNTVDGVLFFHQVPIDPKNPSQTVEKLALLKKGEGKTPIIKVIGGTRLEDIEKQADIKNLFVYYDERHTTGTDIPQLPNAINLMTVDPGVLQRNLGQGMMRLRQYFLGQDVEFVIPKATQNTLLNQGLTMADVLRTAIKNQAIRKAQDTYRSYKAQIYEVVRKAATKKLLEQTDSTQLVNQFILLENIFVKENIDNPYTQYGRLAQEENTLIALTKLCEKLKENAAAQFNEEERASIETDLNYLITRAEKSPYLQKRVRDTGVALEVQQEVQVEVQMEQERELETAIEQEVDLHTNQMLGRLDKRKEVIWSGREIEDIFVLPKQVQASSNVHAIKTLFSMPQKMDGITGGYSACQQVFDDNIFITTNWQYTATTTLPIFHRTQKSGMQILAMRKDKGMQFVLLTQLEADQVREWMRKSKQYKKGDFNVWLLQPNGELWEGHPHGKPHEQADQKAVERMLVQVNAINGNMQYLSSHVPATDAWMKEQPELKQIKTEFILKAARTDGEESKQWQIASRSPLFRSSSKAKSVAKCKKRRQEELLSKATVEKMSLAELRNIDPKLVPYLKLGQICELTKKEQLAELKPHQVRAVAVDQIRKGLLPQELFQYLTQTNQLEAIDTQIDPNEYLSEKQVKAGLCNADMLNRLERIDLTRLIPPYQVPLLKDERIHLLRNPLQIKMLNKEVNRLLCVHELAQDSLSKEQIDAVIEAFESPTGDEKTAEKHAAIDRFLTAYVASMPKTKHATLDKRLISRIPKELKPMPEAPSSPSNINPSSTPKTIKIQKDSDKIHQLPQLNTQTIKLFTKCQNALSAITQGFMGLVLSSIAVLTGVYFLRSYTFFKDIWNFCQSWLQPFQKWRLVSSSS